MMTKATILVVEDELIVAENLRVTLNGMGYDVPGNRLLFRRGDSRLSTNILPDLILMDIRLDGSEFDGVETARRIRSRYDIPVVFLTAYADDETLERVKVTEPFAYILKPFNERELFSAIELALHKHHTEQEIKKRDNILFALSFAVEWFLRYQKESRRAKAGWTDSPDEGIREVLGQIGYAVNADMVAVFRMNLEQEGNTGAKIQYLLVRTRPDSKSPAGRHRGCPADLHHLALALAPRERERLCREREEVSRGGTEVLREVRYDVHCHAPALPGRCIMGLCRVLRGQLPRLDRQRDGGAHGGGEPRGSGA